MKDYEDNLVTDLLASIEPYKDLWGWVNVYTIATRKNDSWINLVTRIDLNSRPTTRTETGISVMTPLEHVSLMRQTLPIEEFDSLVRRCVIDGEVRFGDEIVSFIRDDRNSPHYSWNTVDKLKSGETDHYGLEGKLTWFLQGNGDSNRRLLNEDDLEHLRDIIRLDYSPISNIETLLDRFGR